MIQNKNLRKYINILIVFIISFVLLEFFLKIYSKYNNVRLIGENLRSNILPFFEEGEIFKPYKNFFIYKENVKDKRFVNYFYEEKSKKIIKIWDYKFSTNNYGFAQKNDLKKNGDSILFLGDSFTIGWGSEPWIDKFDGKINNLQVINGGQTGAGFWQFSELEEHFSKLFNIEKVIYIFISPDVLRGRVIPTNTKCTKNYRECVPKDVGLMTFPKSNSFDLNSYAYEAFQNGYRMNSRYISQIKMFIRNLHTYIYFRSAINTFRKKNDAVIKRNLESVLKLKEKYQKNVIFIQITSPIDMGLKFKTYETKLVDNFFLNNNIKRFFCDFNNDFELLHKYDYHPNTQGYDKIYNCVKNILKNNLK